ncbi:hypothetical protein V6N11_071709 [Hibiscus sabdariffa]|uniref:Prenylcysteine lyase domain-containing protein n=1 Tax=Hibiscus sabdariffa TaxID=183260 RepID=A0ABR2U141_9ROSI
MSKSEQISSGVVSDSDDENIYNSSQITPPIDVFGEGLSTLIFDLRMSSKMVLVVAMLKSHFTDTALNVEHRTLLDNYVIIDFGACMINEVEADVSTNQRLDLYSLICAHLGFELIVLNSDCHLCGIVFSQKVPIDFNDVVDSFLKYYESPERRFIFKTVDGMLKWDSLYDLTTQTPQNELLHIKMSPLMIEELVTILTRINYGQCVEQDF